MRFRTAADIAHPDDHVARLNRVKHRIFSSLRLSYVISEKENRLHRTRRTILWRRLNGVK
jgi:hypothetical protein